MTYRRAQEVHEKPTKIAGGYAVRRVVGPYQIMVDPVNGSDAADNDGTVTPLKTLQALFERHPESIQQGDALFVDPAVDHAPVEVLLMAGDHELPDVPDMSALEIDLGRMNFVGELTDEQSFAIDHYSEDDMVVWQPAGNPAWTPNEHVGKLVDLIWTDGGTDYHFQYFIVANDTHSLTVAMELTGNSTYFLVGSTATIKQLASRWVGPRPVRATAKHTMYGSGFKFIHFDATARPSVRYISYFFDQNTASSLAFNLCLMEGTGGGPATHTFMFNNTPVSKATFWSCMWLNQFDAIYNTGTVKIEGVIAVNTSRLVSLSRGSNFLTVTRQMVLRNCGEVFYAGDSAQINWFYVGALYCLNVTAVWALGWIGSKTWLLAEGRDMVVAAGMLPDIWFEAGPNVEIQLVKWDFEGLVPSQTFVVGTGDYAFYSRIVTEVRFSYADLVNLYDGDYNFGWGTRIIDSYPKVPRP